MHKTEQRTLIINELQKSHEHITAEELYSTLKTKLPQISLGTIYRNLNNLHAFGYVNKLTHGKNKAYFEWSQNSTALHITCPKCGKINHTASNEINNLLETIQTLAQKEGCESIRFEMVKVCDSCRQKHEAEVEAAKQREEARQAKILKWTGPTVICN